MEQVENGIGVFASSLVKVIGTRVYEVEGTPAKSQQINKPIEK